jgi:hypothetical protein
VQDSERGKLNGITKEEKVKGGGTRGLIWWRVSVLDESWLWWHRLGTGSALMRMQFDTCSSCNKNGSAHSSRLEQVTIQ